MFQFLAKYYPSRVVYSKNVLSTIFKMLQEFFFHFKSIDKIEYFNLMLLSYNTWELRNLFFGVGWAYSSCIFFAFLFLSHLFSQQQHVYSYNFSCTYLIFCLLDYKLVKLDQFMSTNKLSTIIGEFRSILKLYYDIILQIYHPHTYIKGNRFFKY